jgi:hypothetical protein
MSERHRVIAEGSDSETNANVRVVVSGDPASRDLPRVTVEKRMRLDAMGEPRWEPVPEPDATRIALGVFAAKMSFGDVLGPHVPVPGAPVGTTDALLNVTSATIASRFLDNLKLSDDDRKAFQLKLGQIAFGEMAKLVRGTKTDFELAHSFMAGQIATTVIDHLRARLGLLGVPEVATALDSPPVQNEISKLVLGVLRRG